MVTKTLTGLFFNANVVSAKLPTATGETMAGLASPVDVSNSLDNVSAASSERYVQLPEIVGHYRQQC